MRVWKIKIGPETSKTSGPNGLPEPVTFHVAAEHSTDAAAAAKILYAAIADGPEDARKRFYEDRTVYEITEVCKLDSMSLDTLRPQLDVMPPPREIDVADIMDRVSKMAQEIKAAVKKNVAENG